MSDQVPRFTLADLDVVATFHGLHGLTLRIANLEYRLADLSREEADALLKSEGIDFATLRAAIAVKRASAQIDVVLHAAGILTALPYVLEKGEVVESLSLGAGNTGLSYDLETDRQIAEFKFIGWRGGAESIRQNSLFKDLFNLVVAETPKRRVLYLVGKAIPLRFLAGRRALSSVLKEAPTAKRFRDTYGDRFTTVNEFYRFASEVVTIVDLADIVPVWREDALPADAP